MHSLKNNTKKWIFSFLFHVFVHIEDFQELRNLYLQKRMENQLTI